MKVVVASAAWLVFPLFLAGGEGSKDARKSSAPLVTSDRKAEEAASWGIMALRAVAAAEPKITKESAAHMSTGSGKISGGGMVFWATCVQPFRVDEVLAGAAKLEPRDVEYSFIRKSIGSPLPRPRRPVAKEEKVVLVLGADGGLVKVIPDTQENRVEIEIIRAYIKARPRAAEALMKRMGTFVLKIEYHGPKSEAHPSLWCTTNPKLPDNLPPKWLVLQNLSEVWAHEALDHLVKTGTLKPGVDGKRPKIDEPFYSLALSADGVDELTVPLGWGKEAYGRIEGLGRAIERDSGAIARVLAGLKEERKE